MPSVTRSLRALGAAALVLGLSCVAACSTGAGANGSHDGQPGGSSRHVSGTVDLSEAGITAALMNWTPEQECGKLAKFKIDISDGSGKILYVATSTQPVNKPKLVGTKTSGPNCVATYDATVPKSSVYVLKVEQTPAIHDLTMNESDIPASGHLPDLAGYDASI